MSIHVQIRNQDGTWLDADVIHPRVYWSTDVVDLSRYLPSQNGGLQVRLFFTSDHKLDFVGLDTSSPAPIITTQLQMVSATHSSYGDASQALGKGGWKSCRHHSRSEDLAKFRGSTNPSPGSGDGFCYGYCRPVFPHEVR